MKIKMEKELRAKWLKALRGGKYKQTDGNLHLEGQYCCIGVLGRVAGIKIVEMDTLGDPCNCDLEVACKFPKAIVKVNKKKATAKNTRFTGDLIDLNDTKGKNFQEIADYIEKKTIGV